MPFRITILGSNSAVPAYNRNPSAQVINLRDSLYLIDCGEGTQMRMDRLHIRRNRIEQIFISHLHGDHYFGLIGLITSLQLNGRIKPLTIFSPVGLEAIIDIQLKETRKELSFDLQFVETDTTVSKVIFENEDVTVSTIPLDHRIECAGFLFAEKQKQPNLLREKIEQYNIPIEQRPLIKDGADFISSDGKTIKHSELTKPARTPRSFAYCSDTAYSEAIVPIIKQVDLLYHEATFVNGSEERADLTRHSTAQQAATIAKKAEVKKLIIGHFSAKYKELDPFLEQSRAVFPNSALALEGETFEIDYVD